MCLEPAHDRLCLLVDHGWLVRRVIPPTPRDALPLLQGIFILVVYAEGAIKGRWWPQFPGGGHADQIEKITSWRWFWLWPFIPFWRRGAGGQRRRSVGRLNNNGSAAEDEAAARDCRAAPRAMSMQKDPIQALVAGSEGARIWKSLTMPNRFAGVCGPQVTSGPSLP